LKDRASEFIERFGLIWERLGTNRSIGRVLAWLTICDPPEQSAADIGEALQISQANVSTTMRTLETFGLVERLSIPGNRRIHFRIPKNAWHATARTELREMDAFASAAQLGKEAVADKPAESQARILELIDWVGWWRKHYAELIELWEKEHDQR